MKRLGFGLAAVGSVWRHKWGSGLYLRVSGSGMSTNLVWHLIATRIYARLRGSAV